MNQEHNDQLEQEVDGLLKALPHLPAPAGLASQVMTAIRARAALPWYRRSWTSWTFSARIISLSMMLALFAFLCYVAWWAPRTSLLGSWLDLGRTSLSQVESVGTGFLTLVAVVRSLFKYLPSGVLIGCAAAVLLGYAAVLILGTAYTRVTLARPNIHQ